MQHRQRVMKQVFHARAQAVKIALRGKPALRSPTIEAQAIVAEP